MFLIKFSQQQNRLAMYYTIPGPPLPCFPISTPLGHCLWQLSFQICQVDQEDSPHTVPSPSGPTCRGRKEGEEVWRGRSRDQEHSYYLRNYSTEVLAGVFTWTHLSLFILLKEDSSIDLEPCICSGVHYAEEFCIVLIVRACKAWDEEEGRCMK